MTCASGGTQRPRAGFEFIDSSRSMLLRVLACTGLVLLVSCKESINRGPSENQANDIVSTLYEAGISAEKSQIDEKTFEVSVESSDIGRALGVLRTAGLPREQYESFGEVFKKSGLVSTPAEERVRYIYALSQELEKTLSKIDGVVVPRVHVVIPSNDPLADTVKPSSASVFIKYLPSADPSALGPLIQRLVMRSVEGLDADHVSVAFSVAQPLPLENRRFSNFLGMQVESSSLAWAMTLFAIPCLLLIAALALLFPYRSQIVADLDGVQRRIKAIAAAARSRPAR